MSRMKSLGVAGAGVALVSTVIKAQLAEPGGGRQRYI
jgi:hypothetical protein